MIHLARRDEYLANAKESLEKGEFSKGSELLWGAVTQGIHALASARGALLSTHFLLREFMRQVSKERQDRGYFEAFRAAEGLHANFYWEWIPNEEMPARFEATRGFLETLEEDTRFVLRGRRGDRPDT